MKLRHNLLCTALAASTLASLPLTSAMAVGNVKLLFNNNPRAIALSKIAPATANGINYFPNAADKFLRMRLAEPLLCAEFPSGSNANVRFRLLDANGDLIANNNTSGTANTFGGLSALVGSTGGIRYQTDGTGDHRLILNTTNELVCYTYDTFVTPLLSKAGTSESGLRYSLVPVTGNVVAKGTGGDTVFADGFESPFVSPLDVVTTLNAPATIRATQPYVYTITVSNSASATSISGVVVRDFFYKAGSTSIAGAAVFQPGTWTCSASAGGNCGGANSGTGAIFASNVTLAAGGQVTFTATRSFITSPAPATGAQFSVAAAAFTSPSAGEVVQSNNSVTATGTIVVTQPPVMTGLPAAQTILEDGVAGPLAFTLSDPDTNVVGMTVTATSSNTAVVANGGAVTGGSGANRTLTVTPVADANGTATITITASDGTGNTDVKTMNVTVTAVNDAPTFTFRTDCIAKGGTWTSGSNPPEFLFPAGITDSESCSDFTVPTFGPADESSQGFATPASSAVEVVSNSNPALFAQQPRFSTVSNLLEFRPNGSSGTADVTIRIRDNGGTANGGVNVSATKVFRVRVAGAAPTISAIATQTIDEDGATGALGFTLTDADTAVTSLTVTASSSNTALVPNGNVVFGGSAGSRTATVTPAADQFGSAVVTLTVSDGAQQSQQSFTVNVTSVNDAPTFSNLGNQLLPSGTPAGLRTVSGWANTISVGPANESAQAVDSFFVEVLSQSSGFLSGSPQVTNAGNLRYSLASSADGNACLRVTLFDDGPDSPPNNNASVPVIVKVQVGPGSFSCPAARAVGTKAR